MCSLATLVSGRILYIHDIAVHCSHRVNHQLSCSALSEYLQLGKYRVKFVCVECNHRLCGTILR